jgi:hypothetical protein
LCVEYTDDFQLHTEAIHVFDMIDLVVFLVFVTEIGLKWTDSFWGYWQDPWNIFDFIVTFLVCLLISFAMCM